VYSPTGKNADPEFRRERARLASEAANSADKLIDRLVRKAPPLTASQADRLRALLASTDGGQRADA
jgi:hypothetical protein